MGRPLLTEIPELPDNYTEMDIVNILQTYNINIIILTSYIDYLEYFISEQENYYQTIINF